MVVGEDEILGVSRYLAAGRHEDIDVRLDRPLLEAATLTATIQTDTNENGSFDATTVKLSCSQRDEESAVVSDTATVSLPEFPNAEITFRDQVVEDTIVVESATLPEGGWVTLFAPKAEEDYEDEYVSVNDSEYLEPGRYEDISIRGDFPTEPGECSAEIIALLIGDVEENHVLEFSYHFPGPDLPYSPGGSATAVVTKADCP